MRSNKKVLHIITRLIVGGAQENTMFTMEGLLSRGWDAHLLSGPTAGPEGEIVGRIRERNIPLTIEPSLIRNLSPKKDVLAFFRLYSFFRAGRYSIVHTHSSKAGIIGRWAAYFARVPNIIHTVHGLPYHFFQPFYIRYFYVLAEFLTSLITHKILYVSGNNMQSCLIRGIGRKRDSHIVRSGLNIDDFLNAIGKGAEIRRKFGCGDDDMIFATVARLFHLKGHKYILQAAPEIIRKHPGVKFMFIGDGILRERFERIAREEGISENIIFTGLIPPEEIPIYLDSCDGIIHPSLREGLPRVVPQAFLLEKPVVVFDVDGASEVVIPNITGFLIPPGDMINLKKSLNYVINNTEGAKKMALSGKKLILREFTIDKMVGDIEDIYKRMLIDG